MSSTFEELIPHDQDKFFQKKHLDMGSRMVVFPDISGETVLRAPHMSEKELIEFSGESGRFAAPKKQNPISVHTIDEIEGYKKLKKQLGQHTVGVTPFYGHDKDGVFRTYSLQRRVNAKQDLTDGWRFKELNEKANENLRAFVAQVRLMIKRAALIPDFAGRGNVLLDEDDEVWVVDVNNVRPVLNSGNWLNGSGKPPEEVVQMIRNSEVWNEQGNKYRANIGKVLQFMKREGFLSPEYLDDKGLPIADSSLDMLLSWERHLGIVNNQTIESDEFYQEFFDHYRRQALEAIEIHAK